MAKQKAKAKPDFGGPVFDGNGALRELFKTPLKALKGSGYDLRARPNGWAEGRSGWRSGPYRREQPVRTRTTFGPARPEGRSGRVQCGPFGTTHTRVARGVQGPARTGSNDLVLRCGFATHRSGGTAWGVRINLFARPIVVLRRHPTHFCFIKQKPFGSAARIWMTA